MPEHQSKIFIFAIIALIFVGSVMLLRISHDMSGQENNLTFSNDVHNVQVLPDNSFFDQDAIVATSSSKNNEKPNNSVSGKADIKTVVDPIMSITARAYLIGDINSGKIIVEKNSDMQMPVASMSKLITAIVAIDTLKQSSVVEITPEEASAPPDSSGIGTGEKFTVHELLYPMLLDSSNIAAEAIASSSDRMKFLETMSSYAWEVGMPQAYFADPSGVNPHNVASAKGIFALAQYLYNSRQDILEITKTADVRVATTTEHGAHQFSSIHPFVHDPRFIGGKTGRTPEAGETMLTILNINNRPTAFVVMGASYGSREGDTNILIKTFIQKQTIR